MTILSGTRNLLVLRAGDRSLHQQWLAPKEERQFDLAVNYYGDDEGKWDDAQFYAHTPGGLKFPSLAEWVDDNWALVSTYDYIGFPDDDIAARPQAWGRMFTAMSELGLHLAQPALSPSSYWSYSMTVQDDRYRCRYTNFVEIMMPVFSLAALTICLPTFRLSPSGFGLDSVWPKLLDRAGLKLGIVDEVAVEHTRAVTSGQAANAADKTSVSNFLPHPAVLDDALLKEIFALPPTPDPTVYSAVPKARPSGVLPPLSFVTCLAGLERDCDQALQTIAEAVTGAQDEVIVVTSSTSPASAQVLALGDKATVKFLRMGWGTDLTSQYCTGVTSAHNENVVMVGPGSRSAPGALAQVRQALAVAGAQQLVVAVPGGGHSPHPVALAGPRSAFEAAGGFGTARAAFTNPNGTFGAIGARELMSQLARQAVSAGWHLTPPGVGPVATDGELAATAGPATTADLAGPGALDHEPGPEDAIRAPSQRFPVQARLSLAPDAAQLAAFSWPFLSEGQSAQLQSWLGPTVTAPACPQDWVGLAGTVAMGGHVGYATAVLLQVDLAPLGTLPNAGTLLQILMAAGATVNFVVSKMPEASVVLSEYIAAQVPQRSAELLEQWWSCQPGPASTCATALAGQLPPDVRQLWLGRRQVAMVLTAAR